MFFDSKHTLTAFIFYALLYYEFWILWVAFFGSIEHLLAQGSIQRLFRSGYLTLAVKNEYFANFIANLSQSSSSS